MSTVPGSGLDNQRRHTAFEDGVTVGFLTDASLCIGCKACEVACKEWNGVPADGYVFTGLSYDNTVALGAATWRHVAFREENAFRGGQRAGSMDGTREAPFRWVFLSDVCKHCEVAGCLEACPTGAIVRTRVGSVFVQDDVCNGCGYCIVSCPFGVIDRRTFAPGRGGAFKCTLCYDRQKEGMTPACAKTCPTESILFGPLEALRRHGRDRLETLRERGFRDAALYDASGTSVDGVHALFVTIGDPTAYGLPPRPEAPLAHLAAGWTAAAVTAAVAVAAAFAVFAFL